MKCFIDGVGFSQRAHFDCTEQAFEVALRYHGYELEDVLFDEWHFNYWQADPPQAGYAVNAGDPIERVAKFAAFGVDLLFRHQATPEATMREICCLVNAGKPVPVWVDPYYLSYYTNYTKNRRRHTVHSIVVVGYDDEANTVQIVDPSPWQIYRGEIEVEALQGALSSANHAQASERNAWVEFRRLEQLKRQSGEVVRRVLKANTGAMLASARIRTGSNGAPAGTIQQGVVGIRAFERDMIHWGEIGEEGMTAFMLRGREMLSAIARRRYGHARFLASAGTQLGNDRLTQTAQALEALAEAWFLPANMLFKGSVRRSLEMLPKVAQRLDNLADREEALVEDLRKVAESC